MKSLCLGVGVVAVVALGAATIFACAADESGATFTDAGPNQIPEQDATPGEDAEADGGCGDAAGCVNTTDCTIVDFCRANYPVGRTTGLHAIWGTGADDVWIVGSRGTVLHGAGGTFTTIPTATTEIFFAVWGTGRNDVWFLDGTSPLHSTGFANGTATLEPVYGSSWNPEFATMGRLWAGYSGTPETVWLGGEPTSRFTDSFGNSGSFWRLGSDPDGGAAIWNKAPACTSSQPCTPMVRAFWASGETLWAVGMKGQTFVLDDPDAGHWDFRNPQTGNDLEGVWGSSANDVWAVGQRGTIRHTTGSGVWTITPSPTTENLHAIWGSSASDVWAVGDDGAVVHYDGKDWTLGTIGGLASGEVPTRLNGIWGSGPDDVWIVGSGLLLHRTSASRKQP